LIPYDVDQKRPWKVALDTLHTILLTFSLLIQVVVVHFEVHTIEAVVLAMAVGHKNSAAIIHILPMAGKIEVHHTTVQLEA